MMKSEIYMKALFLAAAEGKAQEFMDGEHNNDKDGHYEGYMSEVEMVYTFSLEELIELHEGSAVCCSK